MTTLRLQKNIPAALMSANNLVIIDEVNNHKTIFTRLDYKGISVKIRIIRKLHTISYTSDQIHNKHTPQPIHFSRTDVLTTFFHSLNTISDEKENIFLGRHTVMELRSALNSQNFHLFHFVEIFYCTVSLSADTVRILFINSVPTYSFRSNITWLRCGSRKNERNVKCIPFSGVKNDSVVMYVFFQTYANGYTHIMKTDYGFCDNVRSFQFEISHFLALPLLVRLYHILLPPNIKLWLLQKCLLN